MNAAFVSQTLELEFHLAFEALKCFPSEEGAGDEELGPRQSREGASPNYLPLVVCPSSFSQATPSGKLENGILSGKTLLWLQF